MNLFVSILYFFCFGLFFVYIVKKYNSRFYLISTFNINLYIYTFTILIAPVFFVSNVAWYGVGIGKASLMWAYLNESLLVNCIGYCVLIISLLLNEFNSIKPTKIYLFSVKIKRSISPQLIRILYVISILFWHIICIIFCKGYPLLNGNRTFYLNTAFSSIYLFLNEIILLLTFYFAINYVSKHKFKIYLAIGIITIALQGNRAALISNLLLPIFIMALYHKYVNIKNASSRKININSNISNKRKIIRRIIIIAAILLLFGLWLRFVRSNKKVTFIEIVFELLYGNTFSDIRDGAYILKGFHENTDGSLLYGKTYLAALISFLPSSLSEFRYTWSWGRFTTAGLFGYSNHFGLRGGNSMEAYLNFGMIGVIVIAFIQGLILSKLEKLFFGIFVNEELNISGAEYFIYYILFRFYSVFSASSSAYNIYSIIVIISLLVIITSLFRSYHT